MTPYKVLKDAIQAVPAVKYALGIAGVAAAVSVVAAFGTDLRVSLFGTVVIIFLMVVLVLFARLASLATPVFQLPILVLTWFSLMMLMATSTLLVTSVFFRGRGISHSGSQGDRIDQTKEKLALLREKAFT